MLCEICKKNRATHQKLFPSLGRMAFVCSQCSGGNKKSFVTMTTGPGFFSIQQTTTFAPSERSVMQLGKVVCRNCGKDFGDVRRTGKLGCSECYQTFADQLAPVIEDIHGGGHE